MAGLGKGPFPVAASALGKEKMEQEKEKEPKEKKENTRGGDAKRLDPERKGARVCALYMNTLDRQNKQNSSKQAINGPRFSIIRACLSTSGNAEESTCK